MDPGKPSAGRGRGILTQPQSVRWVWRAQRSLDATYASSEIEPRPSRPCTKEPVSERSGLLSLAVESSSRIGKVE